MSKTLSKTPLSDAAIALFPRYMAEVKARLEAGKESYGDESFNRPLAAVARELQCEAMDFAGWGLVMYARAVHLEELALEASTPHRVNGGHEGLAGTPVRIEMEGVTLCGVVDADGWATASGT